MGKVGLHNTICASCCQTNSHVSGNKFWAKNSGKGGGRGIVIPNSRAVNIYPIQVHYAL